MKRVIFIFLFLFLCTSLHAGMIMRGSGAGPDANCPDWGTYLFAWNGDYPSDTDKACLASGYSLVDGTNTGGTFGSDSGTTWMGNAADDRLSWPVTDSNIAHDDTNGITMCFEFKIGDPGGNRIFYEFYGTATSAQDIKYGYIESDEDVQSVYYSNANFENAPSTTTKVTNDDATYNIVCNTWDYDEAGTDHCVCVNDCTTTPTWDCQDDDFSAHGTWATAEQYFLIGDYIQYSAASTAITFRKVVVMQGFQEESPF